MRPVNLIPAEERRDKAAVRTGPIAYLLVGVLAIALGAVTMVVFDNNKIEDRKSEIAELKQQQQAAQARADQLAAFADFSSIEDQRTATIKSLAESRFDWERVLRELALIIPGDVWLTDLGAGGAGGATGGAPSTTTAASASAATTSVTGPSLQLSGCAAGQESVAGFLSALRDIDGVTRVGLSSSKLVESQSEGSSSESGSASSDSDCAVRSFLAQFEIVAAFDAVPPPAVPGAAPTTPAPTTPSAPAESTPASDTSGSTDTGN